MKRLSIVLVVMAIAATCFQQAAPAEETSGIPDEIVEALDSLVGKWESEGNVGDKRQIGGFTSRWERTEDKKKICLFAEFSYKTGGEASSGVTLIGWNAATKRIEDRGFDALGGNGTLLWKLESPTLWHGDITFVENGEPVKAKADLIMKGDSEFVMEAEYDNGDVSRVVFRKVKRERKKKAKQ